MLQYALNESKRQNKKIERYSKVEGLIDQFNIEYNDEYEKEAKAEKDDAKSAFMQRVAKQKAGFWAVAKAVADASGYKKDDFEEILSESEEDNFSETENSEYEPSDSEEDDYSQYDQLETESVLSTDSVEEDYENLSDEYLSDDDSDYDPETDSYEYSDSIGSELESVDDLENIENEYEKTFTNLEMNSIIEKLELNRRKDIVDLMFLGNILLLVTTCMFTFILLIKTQ